jgi:hypothetical protein
LTYQIAVSLVVEPISGEVDDFEINPNLAWEKCDNWPKQQNQRVRRWPGSRRRALIVQAHLLNGQPLAPWLCVSWWAGRIDAGPILRQIDRQRACL